MGSPSYVEHAAHGRWTKVGRCVYCPCGARLYQGAPPKAEHQLWVGEFFDALAEGALERLAQLEKPDVT